MSGFGENHSKHDMRIKDLTDRLKTIKHGDGDAKLKPTYDDLMSRFSNLKASSKPASSIEELKDRFGAIHAENCSLDEASADLHDKAVGSDIPTESFLTDLKNKKLSTDDVDDDFEEFIEDQLKSRGAPPQADTKNLSAVEDMLGNLEAGISLFEDDSFDPASIDASDMAVPSNDRTELDKLMERIDDEQRLLNRPAAVSTASSLPSASTSAVRSEYEDESELLKRLLMAGRDEARLENKYGVKKDATPCRKEESRKKKRAPRRDEYDSDSSSGSISSDDDSDRSSCSDSSDDDSH